jgi:hypothetical protein
VAAVVAIMIVAHDLRLRDRFISNRTRSSSCCHISRNARKLFCSPCNPIWCEIA